MPPSRKKDGSSLRTRAVHTPPPDQIPSRRCVGLRSNVAGAQNDTRAGEDRRRLMVHEAATVAPSEPIEPGPVARLLQESLPGIALEIGQSPIDEVVTVRREDFARVMETAKEDERLALDYLRCLSGVDWLTDLETVYHLYSFKHSHSIAIKVRFPVSDPHIPSISHLWETANWHERETQELFGIVFDGHPDQRPLLTEEGLGYYI